MATRALETTVDLLDALQEKHGWTSDRQIAEALDIPQPTVSAWRRGRNYPTEVHALVIAEALEIPALLVLAIAAADRSPDKAAREKWQENVRQLARVLALLTVGMGAASTAYAPPAQAQQVQSEHYGKSQRHRAVSQSGLIAATLAPRPA